MKTRSTLAATAVVIGGVFLLGTSDREPAHGFQSALQPGVGGTPYNSGSGEKVPSAAYIRRTKLRNALKSLRSAKDAAAKAKAQTALSALLKEQFDADLKQREKEIANIEERVKQLRLVLEKRRAASGQIIDLQIKVLINEAEGLGFPTGRSRINRFSITYPTGPHRLNR